MIPPSLDLSHPCFKVCIFIHPPFLSFCAHPLLSLWSPCLSSNSLMGVLREEVDVLSPDCIQNSSKRHEEKSLNQGDWLLFPLSSSWTTIDDCPRGLGPDSVWLADCSSGPVWGPVNVALWEVPLCALPSDKSSFPRERGAELQCKSKGRVGPQEVEGTRFPSRETRWESVGVCMYVCINICMCNICVQKTWGDCEF